MSQIPGGAFADAITWKRGLIAVGILMIGAASLLLALAPSRTLVWIAMLLHGTTAGIITPAIGAVSLGLVGRRASSLRTGRNYRYAAGGHAATAALMGLVGAYVLLRKVRSSLPRLPCACRRLSRLASSGRAKSIIAAPETHQPDNPPIRWRVSST